MGKQLTAKQTKDKDDQIEAGSIPKLAEILSMVADVNTTPQRRAILATKCLPQAAGWSQLRKSEYAGVCTHTWYNAERDPKFRKLCLDFVRDRLGTYLPELWQRYVQLALDGDRQALERIFQQLGVIDKPEKNDTNVTVVVSVEERQKLERARVANQRKGLESLGLFLPSDG